MRMDKLKKWVSDMHEKTNHFGWFEDMYSCECHGPKCFACRYQLQQRNIIGMTEMRRKLLKHIRIMDNRFTDIVLANAVKDKLSVSDKPAVISHTAGCAVQGLLEKHIRIMDNRFADTVLANAVEDKLSVSDKPAVISHTAGCAVQGLLEDKKERLRTLQQQSRDLMLEKLRMVDVKPTSPSGCASKATEFAKGRQIAMCRSKHHPSKTIMIFA